MNTLRDTLIVAPYVTVAVLVAIFSLETKAQETEVEVRIVEKAPPECKGDSRLWECRRGEKDGMRCLFKFCVNPATGKTVEKDRDLRGIYCFTSTS